MVCPLHSHASLFVFRNKYVLHVDHACHLTAHSEGGHYLYIRTHIFTNGVEEGQPTPTHSYPGQSMYFALQHTYTKLCVSLGARLSPPRPGYILIFKSKIV